VLATAVASGLAGCVDGLGGTDIETIVDGRERVPENDRVTVEFDAAQGTRLSCEFTVERGPPVDVFVLATDQYAALEDDRQYRCLDGATHGASQTLRYYGS
jgi:hypothetical protein